MYKQKIISGRIFIYPTDTIYGLGCNATNKLSVEKIKEIKRRDADKPLSIIAPSIDWIFDNLIVDVNLNKYLPGPYTIILKKKYPEFLSWVSENDKLGIRIPKCDFTREILNSGVPFITTSVNLSGEKPAVSLEDVSEEIKEKVDVIVSGREMSGKPSSLVIGGKVMRR